ncbi:MAG: hypothetical protein WCF22_24555 [Candidatus Sulfotelmatobacter sp.]
MEYRRYRESSQNVADDSKRETAQEKSNEVEKEKMIERDAQVFEAPARP